jgi:pentatricopeptide repeat protein
MKESNEQILKRVLGLEAQSNHLCNILITASVKMDDSEAAEHLFKRLREHATAPTDINAFYTVDEFLYRLESLVDLAQMFRHVPILNKLHDQIRDSYEALLFNRGGLYKVLNDLKRQEIHDGLRDNYWMN